MHPYDACMTEARVAFSGHMTQMMARLDRLPLVFFLVFYPALSAQMHRTIACRLSRVLSHHTDDLPHAALLTRQSEWFQAYAKQLTQDAQAWLMAVTARGEAPASTAKALLSIPDMPSMTSIVTQCDALLEIEKGRIDIVPVIYEWQRARILQGAGLIQTVHQTLGRFSLRHFQFLHRKFWRAPSCSVLSPDEFHQFLAQHPEILVSVVELSSIFLAKFSEFLDDCVCLAENAANHI